MTTVSTGTLLAYDATRLFYREWRVERPRAVLVLTHGFGEHGGRYEHVAARLNGMGISVRAADHRGHGNSEGPRGGLAKPSDLVDDFKIVVDDFARRENSNAFVLGHSLGGLVAARLAIGRFSTVRGLILSSPAFALRVSPFVGKFVMTTIKLFPGLVTHGIRRRYLSHDPDVVADAETDPLNHRRLTAQLLSFVTVASRRVRNDAGNFDRPTLLLVAGDDRTVDPRGSRDFFERLTAGVGTLRWYDGAYHELFNEASELRAMVLDDLCAWLEARLADTERKAAQNPAPSAERAAAEVMSPLEQFGPEPI